MEELDIRNFGPITSLSVKLKKISVFIGEQGVGKSTVAKILSCMRDFSFWIQIMNDKEKPISHFYDYGLQSYFSKETYIKYISSGRVIIEYSQKKFTLTHESLNSEQLEDYVIQEIRKKMSPISQEISSLNKEKANSDLFMNKLHLLMPTMRTSFYIPAERVLINYLSSSHAMSLMYASKTPFPQTFRELLYFYTSAKKQYPKYKIPFLNLSLLASESEDGDDQIEIGHKKIPLIECSSGIQSVVPLLLVVKYCLEQHYFNSFAIEEPELNLFPTNQFELLKILIAKTNEKDCGIDNLIITTHSPYLLSILNNFILAKKVVNFDSNMLEEVNNIMPEKFFIDCKDIAVYSLGLEINDGAYCKSIVDEKTCMIEANYLDVLSEIVSSEFNKLSKLYLKSLKSNEGKK